ncbi:hypothetical protein [Streptomyces sp. NRRL F-4489]|uniref:hypothetical protein n=1 Tax=Streptomyces sp. NRRL F-4489 TaxID=1609095 RepID=UPI001F2C949B|nr:hypothetical protein [Streptomyces sp. NRRL F-4489]
MRDAVLFGAQRGRRSADERLGKVFAGIAITAVLCAGCVGWSFLQHTLAQQKSEQEKQQRQVRQYGQGARTAGIRGVSADRNRPGGPAEPGVRQGRDDRFR